MRSMSAWVRGNNCETRSRRKCRYHEVAIAREEKDATSFRSRSGDDPSPTPRSLKRRNSIGWMVYRFLSIGLALATVVTCMPWLLIRVLMPTRNGQN